LATKTTGPRAFRTRCPARRRGSRRRRPGPRIGWPVRRRRRPRKRSAPRQTTTVIQGVPGAARAEERALHHPCCQQREQTQPDQRYDRHAPPRGPEGPPQGHRRKPQIAPAPPGQAHRPAP
jgi:hypothetical protein